MRRFVLTAVVAVVSFFIYVAPIGAQVLGPQDGGPVMSPDRVHVAYLHATTGLSVHLTDGNSDRVLAGPVGDDSTLFWSNDGKYLAVNSIQHVQTTYMSIINVVTDVETQIGTDGEIETFSPDDQSVLVAYYDMSNQTNNIYRVDLSDLKSTLFLPKSYMPQYSPDGKYLTYTTENHRLMLSSGGGAAQGIADVGGDVKWSPNSGMIAYTKSINAATGEFASNDAQPVEWLLMVHDLQTGKERMLYDSKSYIDFDWSPDSSQVVFSAPNKLNTEIYTIDIGATYPKLLAWTGNNWNPLFGAKKIFFLADRTPNHADLLWEMNLDGSDQRVVVP